MTMAVVVVPSSGQAIWTDYATMDIPLEEVFPGETVQCSYELRINEPANFTSLRITAVSVQYEDWETEFIFTGSIEVTTFPFIRTFINTLNVPQSLAPGPHTGIVTVSATEGGSIVPITTNFVHQFVCASEALDVSIDADPMTGQAPIGIDLTAVASGGTGPYRSYTWDFGDGGTGSGETVNHVFTKDGTYKVEVVVRDQYNRTVRGQSSDIVITPPFQVSIQGSTMAGPAPLIVNFTANPQYGEAPYTYQWRFGNGATSNETSPSYEYVTPGTYNVSLTITDNGGRVATSPSLRIVVSMSLELKTSISAPTTTGPAPLMVAFHSAVENATGTIVYNWTFGDGTYSGEEEPMHTYSVPGIYQVHLNVSDSSAKTARSNDLEITVLSEVGMVVTITQSASTGSAPLTVDFSCTVTNGSSPYFYRWNFGDGSISTSKDPTHSFDDTGTFKVRLTVTDSASRVSISNELTVVVGEPVLGPLSSETWIWIGWGLALLATGVSALLLIRYKK